MYLLHLRNGTDDFHEKDQDELDERNMLSLLLFGCDLFDERKNLNFLQIMKEEVKEGGFIQREDGIHLLAMKQVLCHLGVVSLRRVPKKSF